MRNLKTFKKPVQLKLASMSENYDGSRGGKKSDKHQSQDIQTKRRKGRELIKKKKKQGKL